MATDETLIYGFDPLCGWCFAFRPTMSAIVAAHPDLPVQVRYGGLVVGERVQPIAASRDYLIQGLAEVRRRAGVTAGERFYAGLLAEGRYVSNSEPPCRAVYVVQQLAPERAYAFADALPEAFYGRGLPLDSGETLAELAVGLGIDGAAFLQMWQSAEARAGTQAAFAQARADGLAMYPTLWYQRSNRRNLVAQGFLPPDDAVARIADLRHAV